MDPAGVNGYVRNLANGNVELVASGDDAKVNELIQWAGSRQAGPFLSPVQMFIPLSMMSFSSTPISSAITRHLAFSRKNMIRFSPESPS